MNFLFVNVAYASTTESLDQFILNVNKQIINPLILLLFALAVVYFLYGVFQFISNQENEEDKATGKRHMIWGVIGITIMMATFTLMHIIINSFDISGTINPEKGTVQLKDYTPPPIP